MEPGITLSPSFSKVCLYQYSTMEERNNRYTNRIEVSQFGATFLKQLPLQLNQLQSLTDNDKENSGLLTPALRKRGQGIDFQEFAYQTQNTIHKELSAINRGKAQNTAGDSRKKLQLHHDHWLNQQRNIRLKLNDAQTRIEQAKYSEYDWRHQGQALRLEREDILRCWQTAHQSRDRRLLSKLKKIMERKYPGRSASCASGFRSHQR